MFSKIFQSERFGQLLVKIDQDSENKPEIRIYFEGGKDYYICSVAMSFLKIGAGQNIFHNMTLERAEKLVATVWDNVLYEGDNE